MNRPVTMFLAGMLLLISFPAFCRAQAQPATLPATTQSASSVDSDDISPGIAAIILVVLFIVLIAAVLAALLVIGGCALVAVLLVAGVVSSSLIIGIAHRRAGPAMRALVFQIGAIIGVFGGCGLLVSASFLFHWKLRLITSAALGAPIGMLVGLCIAWLFLWSFGRLLTLARRRQVLSAFPILAPAPRRK